MSERMNTQVLLERRPTGVVDESCFRIVETPIPEPGDGELLVRNEWLSVDPYMRGRMSAEKSYSRKVELGEVMVGGTAGEVIASRHPDFPVGEHVVAAFGWQEYGLSRGAGLRKVGVAPRVPLQAYLGVVGMPGVTAYIGLLDLGAPKAGETVVVSAASGAVGGIVGQLAKIRGCRAVGFAGGPEKCAYVVRELGFDACIDHRDPAFAEALAAATPDGIDVCFENVGGPALDTVIGRLNPFARIALCGLIAHYSDGAPLTLANVRALLFQRVKLQGFIVSDHLERWPEALGALEAWVADGKLRYRESVAVGLRAAPGAFIGLFRGENFGKQLVKLA